MKKIIFILLLMPIYVFGQKKADVKAIKAMQGCYNVSFKYAETFAPDSTYEFHDNYLAGALEYVTVVEESKDKIVLQHLLVINEDFTMKHWRQDWLYENTDFLMFDKDQQWKTQTVDKKNVKGQWTQKVYQVDDGLRYQGSGTWAHVDEKHFWENKTDAPLPRREYSKRSDYNVMLRGNRHEITGQGWVHDQDNQKIIRNDAGDLLLAEEKGLNTYTKVPDSECATAIAWWNENKTYWGIVRSVWEEVFDTNQDLSFKKKVDDKFLYQKLFSKAKETNRDIDEVKLKKEISSIIDSYVNHDQTMETNTSASLGY